MYSAYKKRKRAKEQAEQRAQRTNDQWERQQLRELEREQAQRRRQAEQAERDARRQEQERERARKREAEEARRAEVQGRQEEGARKRATIKAHVAELAGILTARPHELSGHRVALEQAFQTGGSAALASLVERLLAGSPYPGGFPRTSQVMFAPESRELLINFDLPGQDVVPAVADYKLVRGRDELQPVPRKDAETKKLYADAIARTTLRTLDEVFQVAPVPLVDGVILNAFVASVDRATGQPCHPLLISVSTTRELFADLNLDAPELDPVLCLRKLNAIVSPPMTWSRYARSWRSTCRSTSSWRRWTSSPGSAAPGSVGLETGRVRAARRSQTASSVAVSVATGQPWPWSSSPCSRVSASPSVLWPGQASGQSPALQSR